MNRRLQSYAWMERYGLSPQQGTELYQLNGEPPLAQRVSQELPTGLLLVAASLCGLGLVFWVAANWDQLGRLGRLLLLQGVVLTSAVAGWQFPRARLALAVLTLLATGALLAVFGQTYQTGADPWQLFALWSALCLPLALGLRHDGLWTPWLVVTLTALMLWLSGWMSYGAPLWPRYAGLLLAAGLTLFLSPPMQRWTGSGPVAWRVALAAVLLMLTVFGLEDLFEKTGAGLYILAVLSCAALLWGFARLQRVELPGWCLAALAGNVLLIGGAARLLDPWLRGTGELVLLIMGLFSALLLALSAAVLLRLLRQPAEVHHD